MVSRGQSMVQNKDNAIDREEKDVINLVVSKQKKEEQIQAENYKLTNYISTRREKQKKKGFFRSLFSK